MSMPQNIVNKILGKHIGKDGSNNNTMTIQELEDEYGHMTKRERDNAVRRRRTFNDVRKLQ